MQNWRESLHITYEDPGNTAAALMYWTIFFNEKREKEDYPDAEAFWQALIRESEHGMALD